MFKFVEMAISCKYCGLKFSSIDSPKKIFCCNAHKMRQHRIDKNGFKIIGVERSDSDLANRLRLINYDKYNESDFLIHKKEHGDLLSKNCWVIYSRNKAVLEKFKKGYSKA